MLRRAKRLSKTFDKYCELHTQSQFKLNVEEWRQVDYLLCIIHPFYTFTTHLSQTKEVTVHNVFRVYYQLFDHLEGSTRRLWKKKVPWKQAMLHALEAGREKLKLYYRKTAGVHGNLYAIGTILAPQHKLQFFSRGEYGDDAESRQTYKECLQKFMEPYQKPISDAQRRHQRPPQTNRDDVEDLFDEDMLDVSSRENTNTNDELTEYLGTSKRHETLSVNLSLLIMRCRPKENRSANLLERARA